MWRMNPQLQSDGRIIASLSTSDWLLMDDARFPWLVQVPRQEDAQLMTDLSKRLRDAVRQESDLVVEVLRMVFQPDHINVAQLGNVVSQLHIHHVARFHDDALWPKPIWAQTPAVPYTEAQYRDRLALLRAHF